MVTAREGTDPGSEATTEIVDLGAFKMHLNPADVAISHRIARRKAWERLETRVIEDTVAPGSLVIDVGANIGYFTLLLSQLVGTGHVFAFEPDPINAAYLRRNVGLNDCQNVTVVEAAVSSCSGAVRLYESTTNYGDHRIYQPDGETRASRTVAGLTLDDYLTTAAAGFRFAKIDAQGAEVAILQGMERLLHNNPALELMIEFWPRGLTQSGARPETCLQILRDHGFELYEVNQFEPFVSMSSVELLEKYPAEAGRYTSLFCTRAAIERSRVRHYESYRASLPNEDELEWVEHVRAMIEEIRTLLAEGARLVVADGGQLPLDLFPGAMRFGEHDGQYNGPPVDDRAAIEQLERYRTAGAHFLVIASPTFWWLEHYAGFAGYLGSRCVLTGQTGNVVVYDIR
jgi:FkbM family methyltransferase